MALKLVGQVRRQPFVVLLNRISQRVLVFFYLEGSRAAARIYLGLVLDKHWVNFVVGCCRLKTSSAAYNHMSKLVEWVMGFHLLIDLSWIFFSFFL